jgi:hypothetical protein
MRRTITGAAIMIAIFVLAAPSAMAGNGRGTKSGNFFSYVYRWVRDDDGDGIPNGLDPDYVRPEDGTGYGKLGAGSCPDTGVDQVQTRTRDRIRDCEELMNGDCQCAGNLHEHQYQYRLNRDGVKRA